MVIARIALFVGFCFESRIVFLMERREYFTSENSRTGLIMLVWIGKGFPKIFLRYTNLLLIRSIKCG